MKHALKAKLGIPFVVEIGLPPGMNACPFRVPPGQKWWFREVSDNEPQNDRVSCPRPILNPFVQTTRTFFVAPGGSANPKLQWPRWKPFGRRICTEDCETWRFQCPRSKAIDGYRFITWARNPNFAWTFGRSHQVNQEDDNLSGFSALLTPCDSPWWLLDFDGSRDMRHGVKWFEID